MISRISTTNKPGLPGLFFRAAASLALLTLLALAGCSARFEFRELRTAEFVVALPGKPRTQARELDYGGPGGPARLSMTMISSGVGPTLFAVGAVTLPPAALAPDQVEASVAWFRDALLRNVRGKLIAAQPLSVAVPNATSATAATARKLVLAQSVRGLADPGGAAGADKAGSTLVAARFIVVDDRLYQVVALGSQDELTPDVLDTFFDSFRLL